MKDKVRLLIESGSRLSVVMTGGGSKLLSKLTCGGGASSLLESYYFPYGVSSIESYLGFKPERFNSKETSHSMALACQAYTKDIKDLIVVGGTCSLFKTNQREGRENSCYLTILQDNVTLSYSLHIDPEYYNTRLLQEILVSEFCVDAIYHFLTLSHKSKGLKYEKAAVVLDYSM